MNQGADLDERFAREYIELLNNRDVEHRRIILTFSGVPGSGKTTLAHKLARDLRAQYVQHDQLRNMITHAGYNPKEFSVRSISHTVIDRIMSHDNNKFVVLDASIDRAWPIFFGHVEEWGIQPIVIRLNVPYVVIKQRLRVRDGPDRNLLEKFDEFVAQFENCKSRVGADFELAPDYDYDKLVAELARLTA